MHCCAVASDSLQPCVTVTHQAPLSMGFSRQEYWSGLQCPPPGEIPDPGIKPVSPALQEDSLPRAAPGKSQIPSVSSYYKDHLNMAVYFIKQARSYSRSILLMQNLI